MGAAPMIDLEELRRLSNQGSSGGGGNGGGGSYGTGFNYDPYRESSSVVNARRAMDNANAAKPADWTGGKWGQAQEDAVNAILNRQKFSYDMNSDALYQQYKDSYINQGKLAMQDTMGQAAALTGGYGNSYAATVGNQAYQSYLQKLNDRIPELYQMALDAYNAEGNRLSQNAQAVSNMYNQEYGQYQDQLSQWNADRSYAAQMYESERNYDYSKYTDSRDFAFSNYQQGVAEDQWNRNFAEQQRQYDQNYAYQLARDAVADQQWQQQFAYQQSRDSADDAWRQQQYDYQKSRDAVADSQWNQNLAYQQSRDAVADSQWNKNFAENQRQFNATNATNNAKIAASAKTGSGNSKSKSGNTSGTKYKNGMTADDIADLVMEFRSQYGDKNPSAARNKFMKEKGVWDSDDARNAFLKMLYAEQGG